MIVRIDKSFQKDVADILDKGLKERILLEVTTLQHAVSLSSLPCLKKLSGYKDLYRISDYRIGLKYINEELLLIRFLRRKEVYKKWPR